ncbi:MULTISPECIES: NfeD family protein [Trichocoleus]|uniref:NfeD-like C-terminal domain-containing protein n=1 Tax=Trichocoleus desertorum GB2-A4 TaxID=2933944 RepID=A0ABV0J9G7_9CYAN|nr:NfeD family protein [Trichocoleus sp. FACHB-262]
MVTLPAHSLWLIGGMLCLALGTLIPEPSIPALGIAAIITAIATIGVPSPLAQMILWGVLSFTLASFMRSLMPKEAKTLKHDTEAWVRTAIPAGGMGLVIYEGTLWQACCQLPDVAIAIQQRVYVVGRQRNTLLVIPANYPDLNISDRLPSS